MSNLIGLIDRLLIEHGSSTILRDNLALVKDQLIMRDQKIVEQDSIISRLRVELAECTTAREQLQTKITELERKQKAGPKICPICGEEKGKFVESTQDAIFGDLGVYIHQYACEGCGHNYEKEYRR